MEEAGEVRVVVGEDSQAGHELWLQLEHTLAESLSPRTLQVTVSQNASELLSLLRSLERAARRPDLVLIDLHVPIRSKTVAMAGTGVDGWPDTTKAGVWIAKRIRTGGNDTTRLVLWTSNVLANELNDAHAFCRLTVGDRPIGDYVVDKAADTNIQAQLLTRLLETDRPAGPTWAPPPPTVKVTPAPCRSLPYLEAGLRSQAIADALVLSRKTVDDHKAILRDCLCPNISGDDRELSVAIVNAARRAHIPWVPLYYDDDANDPLNELGSGT